MHSRYIRHIATRLSLLAIAFIISATKGYAQSEPWEFSASTQAVVSNGTYAPFWLTAMRHGLSSTEPNNAYLRATAIRHYTSPRGFDWECAIDLAGAAAYTSPFIVHQLYGGIRYNCWSLSVGSKEHASQGKNPLLSTGGMTWSGNARPIPQVRFGIEEYTPVSFLWPQWIAVKGSFSYGRLTDDAFQRRFVSDSRYSAFNQHALLHEKSAFLRIANPAVTPLSLELGLEMDCMFGGELWYHDATHPVPDSLAFVNPHAPADYLRAFIPMSGGDDSNDIDQRNVAGNHFGSIHFAAGWDKGEWSLRAYYEHYFESRCGMTPWNGTYDSQGIHHNWIAYPWFDGLAGIELTLPKNPAISQVVVEYNSTRDQCGSIHHASSANVPARIFGQAFYYYNSSYPAWQHWGMTAGTPLMYSPLYRTDGTLLITDGRIRAFHLGLLGRPTDTLRWRLLATHVRTWGSYIDPLPTPANTFSGLAEVTWQPAFASDWQGTAALALDRSTRLGNSTGLQLGLKKTF